MTHRGGNILTCTARVLRRRFAVVAALIIAVHVVASAANADDALKDPTRPPGESEQKRAPAVALRLEAILDSAQRRVAIVSGRVVNAGDRLGGAIIEEITSDSVRYTRAGREHTIRLQRDQISVRQPSANSSGNDHE